MGASLLVALSALAISILSVVRSLENLQYTKEHYFARYEVIQAYLRGFEDAKSGRERDIERAFHVRRVEQ